MKFVSKVFLVVALFTGVGGFAASVKTNGIDKSIDELVNQFYAKKESRPQGARGFSATTQRGLSGAPIYCPPNGPGNGSKCADVACEKLGHFGCDDFSEIEDVNRACRGNFDSACLESACTKLGRFGCDEMKEIQAVARACVGNYDTSCFDSVCSRLGHFGCDEVTEVEKVLRSCAGN